MASVPLTSFASDIHASSSSTRPNHASWLNQIEIYFSILQRKVLLPNDCTNLDELAKRIIAFGDRYSTLDKPFAWTFTRRDLERRLRDPLLKPQSAASAIAA